MLNGSMKLSKTYHLICHPMRCIHLVNTIVAERKAIFDAYPDLHKTTVEGVFPFTKPIFVWEPMEGSCRPEELPSFYEALKYVDVFSPNENELASLFGVSENIGDASVPAELLSRHCTQLLASGFGTVVVR